MTSHLPSDERAEQRTGRGLLVQVLPLAVGVVLAILVTGFWRQVAHPFLSHDDWEFVLPVDPGRIDQHHGRLLSEGRWINYFWWRSVGHLLTPTVAVLLFFAASASFAVLVARRWATGWLSTAVVLVLLVSPMVNDLSYWPATLMPTMALLAIAVALLPRFSEDRRLLLVWLAVSTVVIFLAYPAHTVLLLIVVVVHLADSPWRELVAPVVTFGAAYVVGTLVAFTLNAIAFGYFGVEVRPSRDPHPVHGLGDLVANIGRAFEQLGSLAGAATIPLALAAVTLGLCLALPELRSRALRLLLLVVLGIGLQSASVVSLGVETPFRSTAWIWMLAVVPALWLCVQPEARNLRWAGLVGLLVMTAWGARYDLHRADDYQALRADAERTLDRLAVVAERYPDARVLMLGTDKDWDDLPFRGEAQYLANKAFHDYGIVAQNCRPALCRVARRPGALRRADQGARVIKSGSFIVIIPTAHRR